MVVSYEESKSPLDPSVPDMNDDELSAFIEKRVTFNMIRVIMKPIQKDVNVNAICNDDKFLPFERYVKALFVAAASQIIHGARTKKLTADQPRPRIPLASVYIKVRDVLARPEFAGLPPLQDIPVPNCVSGRNRHNMRSLDGMISDARR
jgi:hypothetical protein